MQNGIAQSLPAAFRAMFLDEVVDDDTQIVSIFLTLPCPSISVLDLNLHPSALGRTRFARV